ncbi:uncharacterized protein BO80DRAFT_441690 [Aspergillus ibericus CBS 121593]|uniref:Uncharacterized protein n=1 Tax=Aspergillus ibericus CBS 121593 TaxID=1448316 RepID=A0A395HA52_9EURO|nr:hypothetical protein BO80DRAFT_441690 [Aspergillus ibericus CBS 121593]RAL04841.1 hypothetical protein BO80DRAFT_441690 [Aspergillus ibericus CBS 121593]
MGERMEAGKNGNPARGPVYINPINTPMDPLWGDIADWQAMNDQNRYYLEHGAERKGSHWQGFNCGCRSVVKVMHRIAGPERDIRGAPMEKHAPSGDVETSNYSRAMVVATESEPLPARLQQQATQHRDAQAGCTVNDSSDAQVT